MNTFLTVILPIILGICALIGIYFAYCQWIDRKKEKKHIAKGKI